MPFTKGHKINLGKKYGQSRRDNISRALKGKHSNPSTEFKKGHSVSEETRSKIRNTLKSKGIKPAKRYEAKGEKCPFWRGGKMASYPELVRLRKSGEYYFWRKAIFERDNFTCQKSGVRGGRLVAHHINNFVDFPELRFAIDNGITLSEEIHREFHSKYGKISNTREQLKEFINSATT